jgi:hypothetical protein
MKQNALLILFFSCSLLVLSMNGIAQDTPNDDGETPPAVVYKTKGFRVGIYIGSYFANQYTASMYDGYGFDIDGNKNSWDNSLMNQKINIQYGYQGPSGQIDQIARALNVDPQQWTFGPSDMPTNMRYNPAFSVGLNCIYSVDKKNGIIMNLNAIKLNVGGNFTIVTPQQGNATQINNRIKTFSVTGVEQRALFQFGYQRILGDNEKMNLFVEAGLNATLTKFVQNYAIINGLKIDLTSYNNQTVFANALPFKHPIGVGFGAFAGIGANITMSPKYTIQLLYSPTYEKVNIGLNPQLKLQNSVGLRAYYNF